MPVWLEWQTRSTQNRVSERTCGFDSHHRYMNRKIIPISHERLREILNLPSDVEILAIDSPLGAYQLNVLIAGDRLIEDEREAEYRRMYGRNNEPWYIPLEDVQKLND
jgi:hypothetical protein